MAPQAETKAERKEAGRPGAMDFVPKTLGWGVGGSGVLRGARAAGVGVGRGCSLQGASAGLRGRQQRGRVAISGVCVEVQPPVSFAQRQIVSFAQTGAFPPPETQGETGAGRVEAGRGKSETEAELRRRAAPRAASPRPPSGLAWLSGRSVGGPPASGSFGVLKWAASGTGNEVRVSSAAPRAHRLHVVLSHGGPGSCCHAPPAGSCRGRRAQLRVVSPRPPRFTRSLKADALSFPGLPLASRPVPLRPLCDLERLTLPLGSSGCGRRARRTTASEAGSGQDGPSLVSLGSPPATCPASRSLPVPSLALAVSVESQKPPWAQSSGPRTAEGERQRKSESRAESVRASVETGLGGWRAGSALGTRRRCTLGGRAG